MVFVEGVVVAEGGVAVVVVDIVGEEVVVVGEEMRGEPKRSVFRFHGFSHSL